MPPGRKHVQGAERPCDFRAQHLGGKAWGVGEFAARWVGVSGGGRERMRKESEEDLRGFPEEEVAYQP